MIKFEKKLKNVNASLVAAVRDFVKYNKTDIQIIAAKEDLLEHLVKQGGNLKEVNEARKAAGLWPIEQKTNKKLMKKSFTESIEKGEGVVFVLISTEKRRKIDAQIQNQIDWAIEQHPSISFEVVQNDSFDSIFFFIKSKKQKQVEQLPEELPVVDSEPSKSEENV